MKVVGIDLAGVESKQSGFCILDRKLNAKTLLIFSDKEILGAIDEIRPEVVAIDAPLCLPKGRKSLKKRSKIHFRQCDRELWKHGIKFFPITLGPMRKLTERGIRLKRILEKKLEVIEVYPGGAQDILAIPRKQEGLKALKSGLERIGVKGLKKNITHDELDAVTCALVGKLYLEKNHTALGDPEEGLMIMPRIPGSWLSITTIDFYDMSLKSFINERRTLTGLVLKKGSLNTKRFFGLDTAVYRKGALNPKTKELMGLVASTVLRCDECINYHIIRSAQEGCTEAELREALDVALIVGGSIVIPHLRRAYRSIEEAKRLAKAGKLQIWPTEPWGDSAIQKVDAFLKDVEESARRVGIPIIGPRKGSVLVDITKKHKPKAVLEIGTLVGYSTILMAKNLPPQGKIITIEIDEALAQIAERNIERVGFSDRIRVVAGDAKQVIPRLNEKFDLVFIDATKEEYLDYLKLAEHKLRKGGTVVADNAGIFANEMKNYLHYVRRSGKYQSKFHDFPEVKDGVEVSIKL